MRKVLQLFNGRGAGSRGSVETAPDHLRGQSELVACGWEPVTLPMNAYPLNPLARSHNAYGGLDPWRILSVLAGWRGVACVCGHMESVFGLLLLRRAFRFSPKVIVWEVPWADGWRFRERVASRALRRADMNVVFDSSQVPRLRAQFGADVPVAVISFCIDVDFFAPAETKEAVPADTEAAAPGYVYSVGRDGGRDFQSVVDAVAGTGIALVLRTAAPVRVAAADRERVALLTESVDWLAYRALYAKASVVVIASTETPHACGVTSLLEAMAMGKAIVVTRTAALSDYLPDDDAGVVVPVGDVGAIRRAVVDLMGDPARRERLGRRAREIAVERYAPTVHFRAVAQLLDRVVGA